MKSVNAQITQEMSEVLRKTIGMLMYSFSVEDTEYNRKSEYNFRNYLTSAVNLTHLDYVIFNEIKVQEGEKKHLFALKKEQETFLCFSIVPDSVEPDKVEGSFDVAVDEVVSDVKVVTDTCTIYKDDKPVSKIVSDIAIVIELETKKVVFQRAENWSDNLTIDIYEKDEENMFYLALNQKPEGKNMTIQAVREIFSLKE